MKHSKRWLKGAASLCDELGPDDGVDPRLCSHTAQHDRKNHKSGQLCKVAKQTLSLVMGGVLHDPLLRDLEVVEVVAGEDGRSFYATLRYAAGTGDQEDRVLERLYAIQGFLRAEIARSVKRKYIPTLHFRVG